MWSALLPSRGTQYLFFSLQSFTFGRKYPLHSCGDLNLSSSLLGACLRSSCRLKDMESVILSLANNYKEFNSSQDEGWLINIFVHPYNVPISRLKRQKMIAQCFSPFLCSIIPLMESLTLLYKRDFLSQIKERDMQACSKNSIVNCNPRMKIRHAT